MDRTRPTLQRTKAKYRANLLVLTTTSLGTISSQPAYLRMARTRQAVVIVVCLPMRSTTRAEAAPYAYAFCRLSVLNSWEPSKSRMFSLSPPYWPRLCTDSRSPLSSLPSRLRFTSQLAGRAFIHVNWAFPPHFPSNRSIGPDGAGTDVKGVV
jgi:hypothetical protein